MGKRKIGGVMGIGRENDDGAAGSRFRSLLSGR